MIRQDGALGSVRAFNRRRVLTALRRLDAASRADLARVTGLSRNTVASIVAELQDLGLLRETGSGAVRAGGPGRPPTLLRLAPVAGLALAVDIGQAHVRVAVGEASGVIVEERYAELPPGTVPAEALGVTAGLVGELTATRTVIAAAIGVSAPVDLHGRPATPRFGGLDLPVGAGVAGLTDRITVRNDADLAALGEAFFGAARGIDDFVYIKVAHGIGAGLVLGRRLYRGSAGLAGDLGHVRVREDGDVCLCGNRGCLETLVSARALVAALQPAHPGRTLTDADLFELVRLGDSGARGLVTEAGRIIGRAAADLVNLLNPAAIVVGGSLSALDEQLLAGIRESVARCTGPAARDDLRVMRSECGDHATVLGGLALVLDARTPISS